jgi:hypothetical protein
MTGNTFKRDLKRGEDIEQHALNIIQTKYPDAYKVKGYCKEWDIFIPSINKGIEIKYDPMSKKTGNIVVEIEFGGKPSALSTTKAYRWFFYTGDSIIITSPNRLQQLVEDNGLYLVTFTGRGDSKSKRAYLIKKHLIEETAFLTLGNC